MINQLTKHGLVVRKSGFPFATKLSPRIAVVRPIKRFKKTIHTGASSIDVLLTE